MEMIQFTPLKINKELLIKQKYNIDYRFKIMYTIGIICVIASHLQGKASLELNNCFYSFLILQLKQFGFIIRIRPFSFRNLLIMPFLNPTIFFIGPSWFSSSLFFVETYNILKRKTLRKIKVELNEFI